MAHRKIRSQSRSDQQKTENNRGNDSLLSPRRSLCCRHTTSREEVNENLLAAVYAETGQKSQQLLQTGDITTLRLLFASEAKGKRKLVLGDFSPIKNRFLGDRECAHNLVFFTQALPPGLMYVLSAKSRRMLAKNNRDIWRIPIVALSQP